jgi:hypothetical protein
LIYFNLIKFFHWKKNNLKRWEKDVVPKRYPATHVVLLALILALIPAVLHFSDPTVLLSAAHLRAVMMDSLILPIVDVILALHPKESPTSVHPLPVL